jgi:hypothetical protein
LHSEDPSDDILEIDIPFNKNASLNTAEIPKKVSIPCLVSFNIWQERDINFLGKISS